MIVASATVSGFSVGSIICVISVGDIVSGPVVIIITVSSVNTAIIQLCYFHPRLRFKYRATFYPSLQMLIALPRSDDISPAQKADSAAARKK